MTELLTYVVFGGFCAAVAYTFGRDRGSQELRDAYEHMGELAEIVRLRSAKVGRSASALREYAEHLQEHADWLLDEAGVMDQMTGAATQNGDSHE